MKKHIAGIFCLVTAALCSAATPTVVATGLKNPSKIITAPGGNLLVTETGATSNSARVTRVSSAGATLTILDALPSGLSAPNLEPDGANGMVLQGNTLFVAIGEGDTLANGTAPGTAVGNPKGPSSPLLDCVLQVAFSKSVDQLASGFTLKPADHFTIVGGNPVVLTNTAGDTATITLLSLFRSQPDANAIYRNSHPYGLTTLASDPAHIFLTDAGLNALVQIDAQSGKSRVLTHFNNVPNLNPKVGPPVSEAVPTSVRAYGDHLLVSLLSGFPFTPGDSLVMSVDPATGNSDLFISGLSSTIDVLYRSRANGASQFLVLEFSANLLGGAAGRLKVYDSPLGQVLIDNLKTPSSMALDGTNLYITDRTDGTVSVADIGQ